MEIFCLLWPAYYLACTIFSHVCAFCTVIFVLLCVSFGWLVMVYWLLLFFNYHNIRCTYVPYVCIFYSIIIFVCCMFFVTLGCMHVVSLIQQFKKKKNLEQDTNLKPMPFCLSMVPPQSKFYGFIWEELAGDYSVCPISWLLKSRFTIVTEI